MTQKRWIIVPKWDEFQHYKDRDPKWIKNYSRLMADWNYIGLSYRLRGILHGIWLLYAASGLDLGCNPAAIGRMLGDDSVRMRDIEALSDAGFIRISASKPRAQRKRSDSLEKEVREDKKEHARAKSKSTPADIVRRMITNGVITDDVTLDAELRAQRIIGSLADDLRREMRDRNAA